MPPGSHPGPPVVSSQHDRQCDPVRPRSGVRTPTETFSSPPSPEEEPVFTGQSHPPDGSSPLPEALQPPHLCALTHQAGRCPSHDLLRGALICKRESPGQSLIRCACKSSLGVGLTFSLCALHFSVLSVPSTINMCQSAVAVKLP